MIISHKHKYIFIGLPFSASSSISQELIEQYDGIVLCTKHSNITAAIKQGVDIKKYYKFAVLRDPLDIAFTQYNKYLNNAKNVFTNDKYSAKQGGHVTKKAKRIYKYVQDENPTYEQFLLNVYKAPYDNVFSLNYKYLDYVLDFNELEKSFFVCLSEIGLKKKRSLVIRNSTIKEKVRYEVNDRTVNRIFGPFYNEYKKLFHKTIESQASGNMYFKLLQIVRKKYWVYRENHYSDSNDSYFGNRLPK